MAKRFYQFNLQNREAYWEDIGQNLHIEGVVVSNGEKTITLMLPNASCDVNNSNVVKMTTEEWSEFIRCSDDPKILQLDETGGAKATHRKLRFNISGEVQQSIWRRDGLKCMFCGIEFGFTLFTVDHFFPIESGGKNDQSNYLTLCRKCNKKKANIHPKKYCDDNGLDFDYFVKYLKQYE